MSFYHAAEGIFKAIITERHMRIHIFAAVMIGIFAHLYGISPLSRAVLILTCAAVISAELVNTAIERAVDTATKEFSQTAKLAKDAAAGAVLILAIASVIIAFGIFDDFKKISATMIYIFTTPHILIFCLTVGICGLIFVIFGGKHE